MKIDRGLQLQVLTKLFDSYPRDLSSDAWQEIIASFDGNDHLAANLKYLKDHSLIDAVIERTRLIDYTFIIPANMQITARGIDFLQNDGGLTAILNVQTIKLHSDTLGAIEKIITESDMSGEDKQGILETIKKLPASALQALTNELVTKAILNIPAALTTITAFIKN